MILQVIARNTEVSKAAVAHRQMDAKYPVSTIEHIDDPICYAFVEIRTL